MSSLERLPDAPDTSPLFQVCWDDARDAPGERLRRDYVGLDALDGGDGAATFNLPYGEWVRRFRAHSLAVEALVEPRPRPARRARSGTRAPSGPAAGRPS